MSIAHEQDGSSVRHAQNSQHPIYTCFTRGARDKSGKVQPSYPSHNFWHPGAAPRAAKTPGVISSLFVSRSPVYPLPRLGVIALPRGRSHSIWHNKRKQSSSVTRRRCLHPGQGRAAPLCTLSSLLPSRSVPSWRRARGENGAQCHCRLMDQTELFQTSDFTHLQILSAARRRSDSFCLCSIGMKWNEFESKQSLWEGRGQLWGPGKPS